MPMGITISLNRRKPRSLCKCCMSVIYRFEHHKTTRGQISLILKPCTFSIVFYADICVFIRTYIVIYNFINLHSNSPSLHGYKIKHNARAIQ